MSPVCPWCKADLFPHCRNGHPTCSWHTCKDCGTVMDLAGRHAHKAGVPVAFPYSEPEATD